MPRLRRSGTRVVSTRSAGMGWTVKIIRRCLCAGGLRPARIFHSRNVAQTSQSAVSRVSKPAGAPGVAMLCRFGNRSESADRSNCCFNCFNSSSKIRISHSPIWSFLPMAKTKTFYRSRFSRNSARASRAMALPLKTLSAAKALAVSCAAIFRDFSRPTIAG